MTNLDKTIVPLLLRLTGKQATPLEVPLILSFSDTSDARLLYSYLTNKELKEEILHIVQDLRRFAFQQKMIENEALNYYTSSRPPESIFTNTNTEELRKFSERQFTLMQEAREQRDAQAARNYSDRFETTTILLVSELNWRSREYRLLSHDAAAIGPALKPPWSFQRYWIVPDALEKMASTLPEAGNIIYSELSNNELKNETFKVVQGITELRSLSYVGFSEQERVRQDEAMSEQYVKTFRVPALMLDGELESRFPTGKCPRVMHGAFLMPPSSWWIYQDVSATLATLANALPDSDQVPGKTPQRW
jgi:hypothetical protein